VGTANEGALASALGKARRRLIPLLSLCYLVAYMDRVNISFAAESMNRALHFSPKVYGLGSGLFFVTYALCEIPSNRMLLRFGARRWLARIMLRWGLLAAGMMFISGTRSFYGMRMLLGVAEAGYFPGVIFYLSQWFPARERARSISWFYISLPLSNVVMGGAAGLLLRQQGRLGLAGWQWLFLVEGIPAIVLSVVVWKALPDGPASASWLTVEERQALTDELASEPSRKHEQLAHGAGLRLALTSGRVWTIGLFFFLSLGSLYALTFSLPTILGELTGWNAAWVGYLVAGIGALGALVMLANAASSDRTGERRLHIIVPCTLMGLAFLVAGLHLRGWGAVAALAVAMCCYYAMQGPALGLPTMSFSGEAAAVAIATMTMCGIVGGFVGPYFTGWMRETTGGYAAGLEALCLPLLLASACTALLLRHEPPREMTATVGSE
jgi:ACS family tartrate transporter-like MFS transporter